MMTRRKRAGRDPDYNAFVPTSCRPGTGKGKVLPPWNGRIEFAKSSCILRFQKPQNVLSTSWLNGGYRTDLTAVFNHRISQKACDACHSGASVREYLEGVARNLGLEGTKATGLITRAEMKNAAIAAESFRDLNVTAIVTAGIDKNGGRAGDPAAYYENGNSFEPVGGTINTILLIGADLPGHTMARAVMTATEAKAAALQQLMARSLYSTGIATGSGTDMIAVVSDPSSPLRLTDAGKHAKLGELIARSVIRATCSALEKETGLSPCSQCDVLVRLGRYRITREDIWDAAATAAGIDPADCITRERFFHDLAAWAKRPGAVALAAAALHVVDEAEWGLIPKKEACRTICRILEGRYGTGKPAGTGTTPLRCLTEAVAGLVYGAFRRDDRKCLNETHDENLNHSRTDGDLKCHDSLESARSRRPGRLQKRSKRM